jgi:hypothetical protein
MSYEIFVSPEGDWYSVEKDGEVLISGHRPTVHDMQSIIEYFINEKVEVIEDEHVGK